MGPETAPGRWQPSPAWGTLEQQRLARRGDPTTMWSRAPSDWLVLWRFANHSGPH